MWHMVYTVHTVRLCNTYFKHKIYMLIAWVSGMYIFVFIYVYFLPRYTHMCIAIYACCYTCMSYFGNAIKYRCGWNLFMQISWFASMTSYQTKYMYNVCRVWCVRLYIYKYQAQSYKDHDCKLMLCWDTEKNKKQSQLQLLHTTHP